MYDRIAMSGMVPMIPMFYSKPGMLYAAETRYISLFVFDSFTTWMRQRNNLELRKIYFFLSGGIRMR
jgi:hypothetical protein